MGSKPTRLAGYCQLKLAPAATDGSKNSQCRLHKGKHLPQEIVEGKHDDIPESAFLFAGTIDDVVAKAKGGNA